MNDRIRKLALQAGIITEVWKTDAEGHGYKVPNYAAEKFAELIVRECIKMVENEAAQYAQPTWAVELFNDIKENFGIEP